MKKNSSRFILGTSQFGFKYGIANRNKDKLKKAEINKILNYALENNITKLDTAYVYGDSLKTLGEIGVENFQIISKIPHISCDNIKISSQVKKYVCQIIDNLNVKKISYILIHSYKKNKSEYNDLVLNNLLKLKAEGIIDYVGVSLYNPYELFYFENYKYFDVIQVPYNIFDKRILDPKILNLLRQNKISIHIRSIFLQGLLLMEKELPKKFLRWKNYFDIWHKYIKDIGSNCLQVNISHATSVNHFDGIIVGVDNFFQFQEIIRYIDNEVEFSSLPDFIITDERLINPYEWESL